MPVETVPEGLPRPEQLPRSLGFSEVELPQEGMEDAPPGQKCVRNEKVSGFTFALLEGGVGGLLGK